MFKECVEFCGEAQPYCRHYQLHFALNYSALIFLVLHAKLRLKREAAWITCRTAYSHNDSATFKYKRTPYYNSPKFKPSLLWFVNFIVLK